MAASETTVRIHAFSTGTMTSPLDMFLAGETGEITYPVPVFLIEHPGGLVLVDSGLHPDLSSSSSRLGSLVELFAPDLPADGSGAVGPTLASAGFDPEAVDHVVLTHLHFDHAGGLVQLPNARVVVQQREWGNRHDENLVSLGAYHPDDFELGHDRLEVDGDHDLFGDGTVVCLLTDGHTAGHQSVLVRSDQGEFVLCGDCCYLRRTLLEDHLPPFGSDPARQRAALERIRGLERRGVTPVFGHDPEQWADIVAGGLRTSV